MFEVRGTTPIDGAQRITVGTKLFGVLPLVVHAYRVGTTLIDAGSPHRVDDLLDLLAPDQVEHVLLTHHHEDHVGGAARLQARGATVHAPRASLEALADPPPIRRYQHKVWGRPEPVEAAAYEDQGDRIETPDGTFRIVPTPGHSEDHVAILWEEEGWLFAGDGYLGPRTILRQDEALAPLVESLEHLRGLELERILPGHGSIEEEPDRALADTIAHYRGLAGRARELAAQGHGPTAVRRRLLGYEGVIRYYTGGHFSKQELVDELLAWDPKGA